MTCPTKIETLAVVILRQFPQKKVWQTNFFFAPVRFVDVHQGTVQLCALSPVWYYLSRGYAVLSVDVKKKELLGRFHRPGQCLSQGERTCLDHDFPSFSDGKVVPHGIYDIGRNEGHLTLCDSKGLPKNKLPI
jgi:hypothetical protein